MKYSISFLLGFFPLFLFSQYNILISESGSSADLDVQVGESISSADINVEIGERVSNEDLTVGFTRLKSKADVIITSSLEGSDISIRIKDSGNVDLSVDVSDKQSNEDIRIKIEKPDQADYLVYSREESLKIENLVVALLPIINSYLDYEFEEIPHWSDEGLELPITVIEPTVYCCPNRTLSIRSIDGQIMELSDGSRWFVPNNYAFISARWNILDDVTVMRSYSNNYRYSYGLYIISRRHSLFSSSDQRVVAVCIGN